MADALASLRGVGRLALIDLVRSPSHEARLAFPSLMRDVAGRVGGRLAWAGSIDQQLIGQGLEHFHDVVISELPTGEACLHALAERRAWQPESFVSELATFAARPWSGLARLAARVAFAALRLRGGGPKPLLGAPDEAWIAAHTGGPVGPSAEQLRTLLSAEGDDRVVMLNLLRHRDRARAEGGPGGAGGAKGAPASGAAAYAAYGRTTASLVGRMGGRIRYAAQGVRALGGASEAPWDALALVEYPSRAAFLGMLHDARYERVTALREAGLESTQLLVCTAHAAWY